MIVISGALVLVALVLLLIGLLQPDLAFVYASIVVSLVSFGFLIRGVLQRRGETFGEETQKDAEDARPGAKTDLAAAVPTDTASNTAANTATDTATDTAAVAVPSVGRDHKDGAAPVAEGPDAVLAPAEVAPVDASSEVVEGVSGTVLVVAGRPRYHVSGCRYLTGKQADEVEVADAREEGFTACGVCKPDLTLERAAAEPEDQPVEDLLPAEPLGLDAGADPEPDDVREPVQPVEIEVIPAARRATRKAAAATTTPAPVRVAKTATSTSATTAKTPPAPAAPTRTPARKATTVSAAAAAAAATGVAAPTRSTVSRSAVGRGSVVVIPDRGKFHTSECRYVRGVAGAQVLSRTAATRAGYDACGVCKP